jgi:diguanylate cyclase (GGDEF)-like protein
MRPITQLMQSVWQTREGLPQNSVQAIVQTLDGYIWIGTQDGLARFDGVRFTVFNKENTPSIRHNNVRALCEGRNSALWIGTDGGLVCFRKGEFTSYTTDDGLPSDIVASIYESARGGIWVGTWGGGLCRLQEGGFSIYANGEGLSNNYVAAIHEDHEGSLWVGTYGGGLCHLKDGRFTVYTTRDGLSHDRLRAIHEDREGNLWIGTRGGGLCRFKDGVWQVYTTEDGLANDSVWAIYEDRKGSLWIGTYGGGLSRYEKGSFTSFTTREGLSDNFVWSFCEDREGGLWIGTGGGGLNRLQDGKFTTYTTRDGLANDIIWSLYEDRERSLWIGTYGGGLSCLKDGVFKSYTTQNGLSNDFVEAIYGDSEGRIWVGTDGGGLCSFLDGAWTTYTTREGLAHNAVSSIYEDGAGSLWIGTKGGGLNRFKGGVFETYTSEDGLSNDFVRAICEDKERALWAGTRGGGLSRLQDGVWTNYTTRDGLSSNVIFSIYDDGKGSLWVCTGGGGLNRFKDGRWRAYTTRDGFFHDSPFKVLEDGKGNLWASCTKGIFRISRQELDDFDAGRIERLTCAAYDEADGMRSSECNGGFQSAGWKTSDGRLWFPTIKGAVVVNPAMLKLNELPPPVVIEKAIVDKTALTPNGARAQLPPGKGELEFHYAGLSFLSPEKVSFKYRLEGFDREWIRPGTRRVAYYTNIPPGDYRFRVTACNNDGVWNETGASFEFRLQPHFYQTKGFYALGALALGLTSAAAYRLRVRQLQAHKDELVQLVEERTRQLADANQILQKLSNIDALTGVSNRRHFDETLDVEWRRAYRTDSSLSLLMIDIDYFKDFNDTYGHQRGDECLRRVAGVLCEVVSRAGDLVARYGGEEFAVILQGNSLAGAQAVAEALRSRVEALGIRHEKSPISPHVTICLGVANLSPKETGSHADLLAEADRALYRAKREGRNRVQSSVGKG